VGKVPLETIQIQVNNLPVYTLFVSELLVYLSLVPKMSEFSSENSLSDSTSPVKENHCVICLGSICDIARIKSCSHAFCLECIRLWLSKKQICPLCKCSVSSLLVLRIEESTGIEVEVEKVVGDLLLDLPKDPATVVSGENDAIINELDCLDHSFFMIESSRLLTMAKHCLHTLFPPSKRNENKIFSKYGFHSNNPCEERNVRFLENMISNLEQKILFFQSDNHFNPHETLSELYRTQEHLNEIWSDPFGFRDTEEQITNTPLVRYGADDFDRLGEEDTANLADGSNDDEYEGSYKGSPSSSTSSESHSLSRGSRRARKTGGRKRESKRKGTIGMPSFSNEKTPAYQLH